MLKNNNIIATHYPKRGRPPMSRPLCISFRHHSDAREPLDTRELSHATPCHANLQTQHEPSDVMRTFTREPSDAVQIFKRHVNPNARWLQMTCTPTNDGQPIDSRCWGEFHLPGVNSHSEKSSQLRKIRTNNNFPGYSIPANIYSNPHPALILLQPGRDQ